MVGERLAMIYIHTLNTETSTHYILSHNITTHRIFRVQFVISCSSPGQLIVTAASWKTIISWKHGQDGSEWVEGRGRKIGNVGATVERRVVQGGEED
jgi:hypothetical protein